MATADGSSNDPTINGAEPFNANGDDVGGSGNGASPSGSGGDADGIDPSTLVGTEPPKRGRGRPRKNAAGNDSNQAGEIGGAKSGAQTSAAGMDVNIFATQLQGFHAILAKVSKNDIWLIHPEEAVKLAKSIKEVMKLHKIAIPSKYMVYGNLFAVSAAIYGPRLAMMAMQKKQTEPQPAENGNGKVFDFTRSPVQQ